MDDRFDLPRLLELRKLTTSIANILEEQLNGYLTTLLPLFRPHTILGNHTRPGTTATVKGAEKVFAELQQTYVSVAGTKLYNMPKVLEPPIDVATARPEIARVEYAYEAKAEGGNRKLTAISPLKWFLTFAGMTPARLKSLLAQGTNVNERDLRDTMVHLIMMNLVVSRKQGLNDILAALGFSISSGRAPEFGDLPLTFISGPVATERPPDDVMIQIAEVSGSPIFEEVVKVEDIVNMKTPLKDRMIETVRAQAPRLLEVKPAPAPAASEPAAAAEEPIPAYEEPEPD